MKIETGLSREAKYLIGGVIIGVAGSTFGGRIAIHGTIKTIKKQYQPQKRDVIGDPNASNPNDIFVETPRGRAYYAIDGKSIEDHINETRKLK